MNNIQFWKSFSLVVALCIAIGLFGTGYGLVVNLVSPDTYQTIKTQLNSIFIVDAILIFALMITSLILIQSDPSVFQPYILIVSHVTLLVSLLAASYATIKVTTS